MEIEIELCKEDILERYDDGCREVKYKISVAENISPRRQRQAVIYEVLASLLGYAIPHDQLTSITHKIGDALDQLEAMGD